jgi:hypothetical protein
MHQIDIRHIADDPTAKFYNARGFNSNSLLLKVPAWLYAMLQNREEISAHVSTTVTDAINDARHDFSQDKAAREWKYLVLDFPTDHYLSSKEIHDEAGEDEELELEIISIIYSHPIIVGSGTQHWAAWKVVRTNLKVHKRGKIEVKSKKYKAAALLGNLIGGSVKEEEGMHTG